MGLKYRYLVISKLSNRIVSQDAINASEVQPDEQRISYIKVKEPNRIKRNIAILNIMLEEYPHSKELIKLSEKVNNKNYMSSKEYYYTIAKIEFIYDKLLLKDKAMLKSLSIMKLNGEPWRYRHMI